jgi:surfactin synthase thioesterase subunit
MGIDWRRSLPPAAALPRDSRVHELDRQGLTRELVSIGATDPAVLADPELYDLALPIVRADFKAIETYQHRHGLKTRCPVVVLADTADPEVDLQEAIAWRDHAGNEFALHRFSGGHFFIDQHTDKVLDIVREVLSREFLPPSPSRARPPHTCHCQRPQGRPDRGRDGAAGPSPGVRDRGRPP